MILPCGEQNEFHKLVGASRNVALGDGRQLEAEWENVDNHCVCVVVVVVVGGGAVVGEENSWLNVCCGGGGRARWLEWTMRTLGCK